MKDRGGPVGPPPEEPVVRPSEHGTSAEETVETHPAYGIVRVSRCQQGPRGAILFGSDFRHRQYMRLTVCRAERRRSISNDWIHGREELVTVSMSESQWVTFITSPNVGEGAPCTLEQIGGVLVPDIASLSDRRQQFADEVQERLHVVVQSLDDLDQQIEATTLSGKVKSALHGKVLAARLNVTANLDFVAEQFDEHMEQTVERAKAEINAKVIAVARASAALMPQAALPALMEGSIDGEEDVDAPDTGAASRSDKCPDDGH